LLNSATGFIAPTHRKSVRGGGLFLDELKATVPTHPVTELSAEIIARLGGEEAAKGVNLPLGDLVIGACALELGYAVGTSDPEKP